MSRLPESTANDPYDADRPLMLRCACGQDHAPDQHASAMALANDKLEASLIKALFPVDSVRRNFLRAVGANTARAAIASVFPLGAMQAMAQEKAPLEKKDLKIGFIPITCATPLSMAHPLGFYNAQGLNVEVVTAPTSLQAAFAAVALPWDDAQFVSSHSKSVETAIRLARIHPKVGVLTAPGRGRAELVDGLAGRGKTFVLAERIGEENQQVRVRDEDAARAVVADEDVLRAEPHRHRVPGADEVERRARAALLEAPLEQQAHDVPVVHLLAGRRVAHKRGARKGVSRPPARAPKRAIGGRVRSVAMGSARSGSLAMGRRAPARRRSLQWQP